jgi:hypothetical protein
MNMSAVNLDLEFEYARPWLYPLQSQAMFGPQDVSGALARMSMIEASTKSGKTVSAMAWILEQALQGADGNNYWWVALSGSGAIHGTAGKSPSGFKGIRESVSEPANLVANQSAGLAPSRSYAPAGFRVQLPERCRGIEMPAAAVC